MTKQMINVEARKQLLEVEVMEFENSQRFAKAFISSPMIPTHLRDIGSMMIINQMSKDLKLPALGIAQSVYIIKGKIGMAGELIISLLNNSDIFDNRMRWDVENEGKPNWRVRAYNTIDGERYDSEWMDDNFVTKQGWKSNPKWTEMPIQMAKYRTAKRFASLYASEVTMGSVEVDDMQDAGFVIESEAKEETQSINEAIVAGAIEQDAKDAVIIEEKEGVQELSIVGEIEERPEVEPPTVVRAGKAVVAKYDIMERVGFRKNHLPTVVKYFQLREENINDFVKNMEAYRDEFYAAHETLSPTPQESIEVEPQEPNEVKEVSGVDESLEAAVEATEQPYLIPSDVVIHYGRMINAGVRRPDLKAFCKYYNLSGDNIELMLDGMEGFVEEFYTSTASMEEDLPL